MNTRTNTRTSLWTVLIVAGIALAAGAVTAQSFDKGNFDGDNTGSGDGEYDIIAQGADQVLKPPGHGETFGTAVDANGGMTAGKTLVVSDPGENLVHTYHFNDSNFWEHTRTFTPPPGCQISFSNEAVSIDDDTLVFSHTEPDVDMCPEDEEGIQVYHRSEVGNWTRTAVLQPLHQGSVNNLDIAGDFIAWGDPGNSDFGIYHRESSGDWTRVYGDWFGAGQAGSSVSIQDPDLGLAAFGRSGESQVIVARQQLDGTWTHVQTIDEDCGPFGAKCPRAFGTNVDLAPTPEHKLIPGTPYVDAERGEAFTFLDSGGYEDPYAWESNLSASDGEDHDQFGAATNAWDGSSVVGARHWDAPDDLDGDDDGDPWSRRCRLRLRRRGGEGQARCRPSQKRR